MAFTAVTKIAASYYDKAGDQIDLITIVSYTLSGPCNLIAAYVVQRFGLRVRLHVGVFGTVAGKKIRSLILGYC